MSSKKVPLVAYFLSTTLGAASLSRTKFALSNGRLISLVGPEGANLRLRFTSEGDYDATNATDQVLQSIRIGLTELLQGV